VAKLKILVTGGGRLEELPPAWPQGPEEGGGKLEKILT
jgi:hypothetical protein